MLPSENFDCYPKICTQKIVNIFLGLRQENVFFEQKIKGNWINNYVSLVQILNSFVHFCRKKIILKILILNFIFGYCSLIYIKKVSGNLKQKKYEFWKSLWFFENENFASREMVPWVKLPIFWNWTPKNKPDWQKCVCFQKSRKVLNHSTLLPGVHSGTRKFIS